jgi:hypothetical protein
VVLIAAAGCAIQVIGCAYPDHPALYGWMQPTVRDVDVAAAEGQTSGDCHTIISPDTAQQAFQKVQRAPADPECHFEGVRAEGSVLALRWLRQSEALPPARLVPVECAATSEAGAGPFLLGVPPELEEACPAAARALQSALRGIAGDSPSRPESVAGRDTDNCPLVIGPETAHRLFAAVQQGPKDADCHFDGVQTQGAVLTLRWVRPGTSLAPARMVPRECVGSLGDTIRGFVLSVPSELEAACPAAAATLRGSRLAGAFESPGERMSGRKHVARPNLRVFLAMVGATVIAFALWNARKRSPSQP